MFKVLLPSIIIGTVLVLSVFAVYKLLLAHAIWKKCLALLPLILLFIIIYGFTWGFWQLKVREVTYESKDIPEAFDGYKIVHALEKEMATHSSVLAWRIPGTAEPGV